MRSLPCASRKRAVLVPLLLAAILASPYSAPVLAETKAAALPPAPAVPPPTPSAEKPMTMETFLDRVMMAESGGRADLRASRSTALGAYQLIEGMFLEVVRRHFAAETASLNQVQLLALRLNPAFSRRVAEAFTRENATHLAGQQLVPTFQNLRLAYLVGATGAVRVLRAHADTPLTQLLSPAAIIANPFMVGMSARGLIAKAARDLAVPVGNGAGVAAAPGSAAAQARANSLVIRCNMALPSCRKWVALRQNGPARATARLAKR